MKKMLHIKWENIIGIAIIIFDIDSIIFHILKNGFDINIVVLEIIIYSLIFAIVYVSVYALRTEILRKE